MATATLSVPSTLIAAPRNVVIFVADGLRPGSVNAQDAPTLHALREQGVSFLNSHSLYPTFTTPNASVIATGHYLGDTGDFGNALYTGYWMFDSGNFTQRAASGIPFIENDEVLGDLDDHFEGNYLGEDTLLALARAKGYSTAAIGKLGPVAIQDVTQLAPMDGRFNVPQTIIIDDATGAEAPPLPAPSLYDSVGDDLWALGLAPERTAMHLARERLEAMDVRTAVALEACDDGERASVAGVVTHRQHPETARGAVFVNLEDETGHVNVVFSRGAWARWKHVARHAPVLLIRGRVRKGQGAVSFDAERVEALVVGTAVPASRDFR